MKTEHILCSFHGANITTGFTDGAVYPVTRRFRSHLVAVVDDDGYERNIVLDQPSQLLQEMYHCEETDTARVANVGMFTEVSMN